MQDQIKKILNVSESLHALSDEGNPSQERANVIEFLNKLTEDQLRNVKTKIENSNPEKINKIRLIVADYLIKKELINLEKIESICELVAKEYPTDILRSWKSYFSLFLPFIYQEKVFEVLREIATDVSKRLGLESIVKTKIVDFDGANNFGSDKAWIALYNKKQASQSSSLQLFISFLGNEIRYGIYQHVTKSWKRVHVKSIKSFNYEELISDMESDKRLIIDDDKPINCWKFSPGEDAKYWNEMARAGVAGIGWGKKSLFGKSRSEIKKLLPAISSKSAGIVKAFTDVKVGDLIFAFKGRKQIVGYGFVTKTGSHQEQEIVLGSDFHNYHEVKWTMLDSPRMVNKIAPIDTIADISDRYEELNTLFNLSGESDSTKYHQSIEYKMRYPLNQIFYGPPGTGKTFNTVNTAIAIANPGFDLKVSRVEVKKEFDRLVQEGQIVFTTFHQSMAYEDFIEGIKPETIENKVVYEVKDGIFKKLCTSALTPNQLGLTDAFSKLKRDLDKNELITLQTPTGKEFSISLNSNGNLNLHTGVQKAKQGSLTLENIQKQINGESAVIGWEGYFQGVINYLETQYKYTSQASGIPKNFVIIIDEINRGNVSQIFGELITLIEDDKRIGEDEVLEVMLPYSKERFGVPSNLFIIGTMNTADRSVEALDAALRRRFSFIEMPPLPNLIAQKGKASSGTVGDIYLPDLLTTINSRIEKLLDRDHQIGHSYLMSVANLDDLRHALQNKIIPLLKEYFLGDFGKLGLVLGNDFFEQSETLDSIRFADFNGYESADFEDRTVYKLKNILLKNDDHYVMSDESFVNALISLQKK